MFRRLLASSVNAVPWSLRARIKKLPIIAPLQRLAVRHLLGRCEFIHTINAGPASGLKYWVQMPEDKAVWSGTYELELSAALAAAIRPGNICLDIGGYHGFFAGVCALAGAGTVHVFEPLPVNAERIRKLIDANPELPLKLHRIALGSTPGEAPFRVMEEDSMGKLSNSNFQGDRLSQATIEVQMETLDHLKELGVIPRADVIKIDVEGAEAMVLKGGTALLRSDRPRLFLEIHSRELARECNDLLANLGYSISVLETGRRPDFTSEPEVCHFVAVAN